MLVSPFNHFISICTIWKARTRRIPFLFFSNDWSVLISQEHFALKLSYIAYIAFKWVTSVAQNVVHVNPYVSTENISFFFPTPLSHINGLSSSWLFCVMFSTRKKKSAVESKGSYKYRLHFELIAAGRINGEIKVICHHVWYFIYIWREGEATPFWTS